MRLFAQVLTVICVITHYAGFGTEPEYKGKTLEEWKRQLKDPFPGARCEAAVALGEIGPRSGAAVPALSALLEDADRVVRSSAADAMGLIGSDDQEGIATLIRTLDDKDGVVRICAARALGRIGIAKVPGLAELVATKHPWATLPIANALSKQGPKDKAGAVSILTRFLQKDSVTPAERFIAACHLGSMGPDAKAAIPVLTKLLREKKSICSVAVALWRIGPEGTAAAMPILGELLRDPDDRVRSTAAQALENIAAEAREKRAGESKHKW